MCFSIIIIIIVKYKVTVISAMGTMHPSHCEWVEECVFVCVPETEQNLSYKVLSLFIWSLGWLIDDSIKRLGVTG